MRSRCGLCGPGELDRGDLDIVVVLDEVLLEAEPLARSRGELGGDRVIGSGQKHDVDASPVEQLLGHGRQRGTLGESLRPIEVGGEVEIAEAEPRFAA